MESASKPASVLRAQWSELFAPAERTLPAMLTRQAERYGEQAAGQRRRHDMELCRRLRRRGPLRRRVARRGRQGRRPGRGHLLQPDRVPRNLVRLRLAWRGGGADQRRLAGAAASAHPVELRRAPAGDRGRPCRQSRAAGREPARCRSHLADRRERQSRFRQRRRDSDAARRRAHRGGGGPARRPRPHPLHLRHHRPVEGRLLPACAILLVGGQHGVAPATAATATCSAPACRCFTPTRSTPSTRRCSPAPRVRYEKRFSASGFFPSLVQSRATVTYLLGAMVPILLSRPVSPEETAHQVTHCARARRAGAVSRRVHAAHRHPPARRLGLDRNQFRSRHDDRAPAARIDGAGVRGLRCARGRRSATKTSPTERRAS